MTELRVRALGNYSTEVRVAETALGTEDRSMEDRGDN